MDKMVAVKSAAALLKTHGLSRAFGGLQAVNDVNFQLNAGEIRAIIGANGAGKTTFVSLLCGRIALSGGNIEFLGRDITALPIHRRVQMGIAYTFQITSIFANLSVLENVATAAQNQPGTLSNDGIIKQAHHALHQVGMVDLIDATAGQLAYGHQRLLEIAMGLALKPKLLILDEPTQGLSDAEIARFCTLVRNINTTATVLLIEHNMPVVMALADRITVLDHGQILAEGNPAEIRQNAAVQAAYLGA